MSKDIQDRMVMRRHLTCVIHWCDAHKCKGCEMVNGCFPSGYEEGKRPLRDVTQKALTILHNNLKSLEIPKQP